MWHLKSSYKLPEHLSSLGKLPIEFYLLKILNYGPKTQLFQPRRNQETPVNCRGSQSHAGTRQGQASCRGDRAQCGDSRGGPECLSQSQGPTDEPEVNAHLAFSILRIPAGFRIDLLCQEEQHDPGKQKTQRFWESA